MWSADGAQISARRRKRDGDRLVRRDHLMTVLTGHANRKLDKLTPPSFQSLLPELNKLSLAVFAEQAALARPSPLMSQATVRGD